MQSGRVSRNTIMTVLCMILIAAAASACSESQSEPEPMNSASDYEVDDRFIGVEPSSEPDDDVLASLPQSAALASDTEAADQAIHLLDARNPRVHTVELMTLEAAFAISSELQNEDPELALAGWSREQLESLAWRVIVEADDVSAPVSCPPPDDFDETEPVSADHCGPLDTPVEMILDPEDGSWISATFGVSHE